MMKLGIRGFLGGVIGLAAIATGLLSPNRAIAAEDVVLSYRIIEATVSVEELKEFTESGEMSRRLRNHLRMANQPPRRLHRALTREVEVNPLFLDQALNTFAGEAVLDQMSQVIHTPSGEANRQALRSALVLSATEDRQITLLEVLENYPTQEVHVDGDRAVEISRTLRRFANNAGEILERIDFDQIDLDNIELP